MALRHGGVNGTAAAVAADEWNGRVEGFKQGFVFQYDMQDTFKQRVDGPRQTARLITLLLLLAVMLQAFSLVRRPLLSRHPET